jgi:hypothetical protein
MKRLFLPDLSLFAYWLKVYPVFINPASLNMDTQFVDAAAKYAACKLKRRLTKMT